MVSLQLQASDPENDVIRYSATGLPPGIGLDEQTGLFSGQLYDDGYTPSPFPVRVTADDGHGGVTSQTFQWSFARPNLSGVPATVRAVQGASVSNVLVGTFTDLQMGAPGDPWPYSATINWGDGTSDAGSIDGQNNNFQVRGSHTWKQTGAFTIRVTVTQGNLGSVTIASPASVSNPDLTATVLTPNFTTTDAWNVPIAVFDDPNPFEPAEGYSATVTWGDDVSSAATVYGAGGRFVVYTGRGFSSAGSKPFSVLISDNEGATVSVRGSAWVGQIAAGNDATLTVALYGSPPGYPPPTGYSATIDWGDGSPSEAGTINPSGDTFSVSGRHRYTVPAVYVVTVSATSPLGDTLTVTGTVTVARKPIQVYREVIETTAGQALSNRQVGVIFDPNDALPGAPTLDWGDGTSSSGTLIGGGGLYRLQGGTTYAQSGEYLVFAEGGPFWDGFWRGFVGTMEGGTGGAGKGKVAAPADSVTPRTGEKIVHKGTLKWELEAPKPKGVGVDFDIWFTPTKDNPATVITFLQVVREKTVAGKPYFGGNTKAGLEFKLKTNVDKDKFDYIDALPTHTDPYYGAEWNGSNWVKDFNEFDVGNGPKNLQAYISDSPAVPSIGRKGKGEVISRFETAVFAVDSQEVLGVIQWGYKVPDNKDGKVELLGATMTDVALTASNEFKKVIEKANTVPEFKHAKLDGTPKITKPNAKKFGGTSALPD